MKIDRYTINLASSRVYEEKKEETEKLREWGKKSRSLSNETKNTHSDQRMPLSDPVTISAMAQGEAPLTMKESTTGFSSQRADKAILDPDEQTFDPKLLALKRLIEALTGKEIKITRMDAPTGETAALPISTESGEEAMQAPPEQAWGMSHTHYESYYESEQTRFSAQGIVNTIDGEEISFSMDLAMSREYFREERLELQEGAPPMVDPLVMNYAGRAAELEDMSFEFDLTMDGEAETIRQLAPGNGFLVFDKNTDGKANDGSELFGPKTGDGFQELAAYDEDKNNWIDENDPIYAQLSLWEHAQGKDRLINLKSVDVGAIYIGTAETAFDLKNEKNHLMAQVRKTGVYLKESGGMGLLQHIDFAA